MLNFGMFPNTVLEPDAWVELVGVALLVGVAELFDGWACPAVKLGVAPEPKVN